MISNAKPSQAKLLTLPFFRDQRGTFFKPFSSATINIDNGRKFTPQEAFFSTSHRNVVRGFHLQGPPMDHGKIVFVLSGKTLDVVVDLRKNSGTFGHVQSFELDAGSGQAVFVPRGFGHAFLSLEDEAVVGYLVDTVHDKNQDIGVLWSSVDFDWPVREPVISARDAAFPALKDFKTPFV